MNNLLYGSKAYLAGPVDQSQDPVSWRTKIRQDLLAPMGVKVYDPLIKPSWMPPQGKLPVSTYKEVVRDIRQALVTNPDMAYDVWDGMQLARKMCSRMVSDADFVICYLPKLFTIGTFEELSLATQQNKPILVVTPQELGSTWLPVMVADNPTTVYDHIFKTWDELYLYLTAVDYGSLTPMDRYKWLFISYFNDVDVRSAHEVPNN